ncbi:hypothetical protein D104_12155 [Marinomonas profundimaris]|uniref:Uncharacterized protein n=1 Tax=Marinomonas profundimaris TaxID=1208321 RepID=W1RUX8_9GAMM|nr:hypothetical protein D104_12155 [Marinomonas profundimaris]
MTKKSPSQSRSKQSTRYIPLKSFNTACGISLKTTLQRPNKPVKHIIWAKKSRVINHPAEKAPLGERSSLYSEKTRIICKSCSLEPLYIMLFYIKLTTQ